MQKTSTKDYKNTDCVHAVIIAYGQERSGVLHDVLEILRLSQSELSSTEEVVPKHGGYKPPFEITHAWVRAVGPIGVVMLRFSTTDVVYRTICRKVPIYQEREARKVGKPLKVIVHRAERAWNHDGRVRSIAVVSQWPKASSGTEWYENMECILNNLSADLNIHISEQDWVETTDLPALKGTGKKEDVVVKENKKDKNTTVYLAASLLLHDSGYRGRDFLKNAIASSIAAVGLENTTQWVDPAKNEVAFIGHESDKSPSGYLENALRGPVEIPEESSGRAYIFVHALDAPGLLAFVTRIVRQDETSIHRSCCHGLGGDGIVVMETELSGARNQDALETDLKRELAKFYKKTLGSARLQELKGMGIPNTGVWNIAVVRVRKKQRHDDSFTECDTVELPLLEPVDGPGMMLTVSDAIQSINKYIESEYVGCSDLYQGVSLYFFDGRFKKTKNGDHRRFRFGLGLKVPKMASDDGKGRSLEDFVRTAWKNLGDIWEERIVNDSVRPLPKKIDFVSDKLMEEKKWNYVSIQE